MANSLIGIPIGPYYKTKAGDMMLLAASEWAKANPATKPETDHVAKERATDLAAAAWDCFTDNNPAGASIPMTPVAAVRIQAAQARTSGGTTSAVSFAARAQAAARASSHQRGVAMHQDGKDVCVSSVKSA